MQQLGYLSFFFFQAEDGIRDYKVTGVQTCALPISPFPSTGFAAGEQRFFAENQSRRAPRAGVLDVVGHVLPRRQIADGRSEERRVGKEGSSWGVWWQLKKKRSGG